MYRIIFILTFFKIATAIYEQEDSNYIKNYLGHKKYMSGKRFRPHYHITAPVGWLNDPSGFAYFQKLYHVFYQYYPYNGAWGPMHIGHVVSNNLVDWKHYPQALSPTDYHEKSGCLAGSAVVHNDYLTLFYTGNVQTANKSYQSQSLAISVDGITFQKYLYNPVIRLTPHGSDDFRNPKVWKFRSYWYMLVGTSTRDGRGCLVLYTSGDMFNWRLNGTIAESMGDMGYVWENPDVFELDGYHVLILSAQGMLVDGYRFRNAYQTGYVVGKFNYGTGVFEDLEVSTATFNELDFGHDFHGVQTLQAPDGRRLLIGWLGMWENEFSELKYGWASMLTIVRELRMTPMGRILMTPVREVDDLRTEVLEDAWYSPGEAFYAGSRMFELVVNAGSVASNCFLILQWGDGHRYSIGYFADYGYLSVDRGGTDGVRRADWVPNDAIHWRIFVDSSSIEVFCGDGEVVFSSRIYPRRQIQVQVAGETQVHIVQYRLRRSVGYDRKLRRLFMKNMA